MVAHRSLSGDEINQLVVLVPGVAANCSAVFVPGLRAGFMSFRGHFPIREYLSITKPHDGVATHHFVPGYVDVKLSYQCSTPPPSSFTGSNPEKRPAVSSYHLNSGAPMVRFFLLTPLRLIGIWATQTP